MKYYLSIFFYRFLEFTIQTLLILGIVFVLPVFFVVAFFVVIVDLCIKYIADYLEIEED